VDQFSELRFCVQRSALAWLLFSLRLLADQILGLIFLLILIFASLLLPFVQAPLAHRPVYFSALARVAHPDSLA